MIYVSAAVLSVVLDRLLQSTIPTSCFKMQQLAVLIVADYLNPGRVTAGNVFPEPGPAAPFLETRSKVDVARYTGRAAESTC